MSGLHFNITGDNSNFLKKVKECEEGVKNASKQIEQSGMGIEDLFKRMTNAAAAFGAGFTVKELISNIVRVRGEFQSLEIAFKNMLGSEEKATKLMNQLVKTAATTPFDLQSIANGAKQLLAYGTAAEDINETVIRLGDIAAGVSVPLGDLIYLYGTTMTQGRMFTQDLRQFMGRGIPLAEELAKQFGVTKAEVGELVTAGRVGAVEFQKAIWSLTNEGSKFGGLMEARSQSIAGQISNIQDAIDSMFNAIGESNEGIINDALSGVSYIVENYEKVGKILVGLVTTYGAYRVAVMTSIALTRSWAVATRADATAKALQTIATKAQTVAIAALNGVMKANPFVLVTTAVVGLGTAMWALHDSTSEVEKMQQRYNASKKETVRKEEEHRQEIQRLVSVANDEAQATSERNSAIEALKKAYPGIIEKYLDEEGHLSNLIQLHKELNETDAQRKVEDNRTRLASITAKVNDQMEYVSRMSGSKEAIEDANKVLAELQRQQKEAQAAVNADYLNDRLEEAKKLSDEDLKKSIQEYKSMFDRTEGDIGEFSRDEVSAFIKSLEALQTAREKVAKNKSYWESKKKEAQEARDALDLSKKNSEEWNSYTKQIQEAEAKIAEYSLPKKKDGDILNVQEELNNELLKLRMKNQQDEINLMEDGTKKKIAQLKLDLQQEYEAIRKTEEKWMKEGNGQLTQEQSIEISRSYTNAEEKFDKGVKDVEERAMNEFLKEYGTYQQKKETIAREYAQRIANASTEGERLTLQKQMEDALQGIDISKLKESLNWEQVFGNLDEVSTSTLKSLKEKLKEFVSSQKNLSPESLKELVEAIDKIDDKVSERNPFDTMKSSFDSLKKSTDEVKEAQKRYNEAVKNGTAAEQENAKAQLENAQDKKQKALSDATKALHDGVGEVRGYVDAGNEVIGIMEALGVKMPEWLNGTMQGVGEMLNGLESIDLTKPMSIVTGALQTVKGAVTSIVSLGGLIPGLGGADYSSYNKMVAEYNALEDVWDRLISKKQEYIDISYGDEARKTAQEVADLLNTQVESLVTLGLERLNSGASAGSHSIGVRQRKNMSQKAWDELRKASNEIGFNYNSVADGRMTGLFDLSAKQLAELQEQAPTFWAKLDDDVREYLQKIIDCGDELDKMKEKMKETMTGISFDSFYDNFVSVLTDMDKDSKAFADDFGDYLRTAILSNLLANKYKARIEKLYNEWANKSDDNGDGIFDLTSEEAASLREAQKALADEMFAERDAMANAFGWDGSASQQQASSKGFETMSQDTGNELNGRFTAFQESNESIKNQMLAVVAGISSIASISSENNITLNGILNQHVITNTHLEDIGSRQEKMIKEFGGHLTRITQSLNKL